MYNQVITARITDDLWDFIEELEKREGLTSRSLAINHALVLAKRVYMPEKEQKIAKEEVLIEVKTDNTALLEEVEQLKAAAEADYLAIKRLRDDLREMRAELRKRDELEAKRIKDYQKFIKENPLPQPVREDLPKPVLDIVTPLVKQKKEEIIIEI